MREHLAVVSSKFSSYSHSMSEGPLGELHLEVAFREHLPNLSRRWTLLALLAPRNA
jgi:hypothetical protein